MILFTTDNCPNCVPVKDYINAHYKGVSVKVINASTPEGREAAIDSGVRSAPTIIQGDNVYVGAAQCLEFLRKPNGIK